ncbi:MAG: DUF2278 family protein [Phycisphaerae bacterium]|nr:DUF2278 family protein [Saprospiraceae bacterium]
MPIDQYGVLKGRAFKGLRATNQSEHYQILINQGAGAHRIAINTKSSLAPSEVLYFASDDFKHEITDALLQSGLSNGFTALDSKAGGFALDFVRRNLVARDQMTALPSRGPAENDDLNDRLDFFVQQAIQDPTATIYAFGQHWQDSSGSDKYFPEIKPSKGIHDIHMNQGNPKGKYFDDNGTWQDGGLLFHFASRSRWAAVFTAFQSQSFITDDQGNPTIEHPNPVSKAPVRIIAALVNPEGEEVGKEYLILLNKSSRPVNLDGWQIMDKLNKKDFISNKMIEAGDTLRIKLSGQGAQLSNKGGNITLLNKEGLKIDGVSYTKEDASVQGELVEL